MDARSSEFSEDDGLRPQPEVRRKGPLDIATAHLSQAADHLEQARIQYESAKATYQGAKAVYEAVEASQNQVLNLSTGTRLCDTCASIPLKTIFSNKSQSSKDQQRRRVGDLFHAVENQSWCSFCKFLIEAFQIGDEQQSERLHAGLNSRDTAIYFTHPEGNISWYRIAGVNTSLPPCPFVWLQTGPPTTTGVPHICVSFEPAIEAGKPTRVDDRIYPREREPIQAFNGALDYDLIQAWMTRCTQEHGQHCQHQAPETGSDLDIWLIDVKTRQLIRHKPGDRFVALSYVWGKGVDDRNLASGYAYEPRRTDTGSLVVGKYQRQARLPDRIPQTMEDALIFVEWLGERYLWIDLYSIDQNNGIEKAHQINAMDRIFSSAYVTLVCLDGYNADWGLPGVSRPLLQSHQPSISLAEGRLMATFVFSVWHNNGTAIWDSRAWTLQERLLSPRCIMFGKTYVAMACQKEYCHDSIDLLPSIRTWLSNEEDDDFWEDGASINLNQSGCDFKTFGALVSVYSGRKLTDEGDALNACKGSLNRLSKSSGYKFIFGLPEQDMLRALLWKPHPKHVLQRRPGFPSWSWLGWSGRSEYQSWLSEMHDYVDTSPNTPVEGQARKKRRIQRSDDSAWHPKTATITSLPKADDSTPQLHMKSTLAKSRLRLLRTHGAAHKHLRTETQQSPIAIGDHWTLLQPSGDPIRNVAGEYDNFESTDVLFRMDAETSKILKEQDEVELLFVSAWERIRDWKKSDRWLFDMVSALLIVKNEDGSYERMASVLVERERWMAMRPREQEVILV